MDSGSRRNATPPINAVTIVSWLLKVVAVIPTSATPRPKTTHLIC